MSAREMEWRSFLLFVKAGTASLFLVSWLCELVVTKELRIMFVDGRDTVLRSREWPP